MWLSERGDRVARLSLGVTTPAGYLHQQRFNWFQVSRRPIRAMLGACLLALSLTGLAAARVMYVQGTSMAPTLYPGQSLLINTAAFWRWGATPSPAVPLATPPFLFGGPRRGDLVVFRSPVNGETTVKRIVGVPGDMVLVDAGRVFVNSTVLDEPYVAFHDDYSFPADGKPDRVPEGAYFVLGDNRAASNDSHLGWFVPVESLVGQAVPLPFAVTRGRSA